MASVKKRALTLTIIFKGLSPNYGESVGNVSELKKLTYGGELYSYLSRQALRYELWKFLKTNYGIDTVDYWKKRYDTEEIKLPNIEEIAMLSLRKNLIDFVSFIFDSLVSLKKSNFKESKQEKLKEEFRKYLNVANYPETLPELLSLREKLINLLKSSLKSSKEIFNAADEFYSFDPKVLPPQFILQSDKEVIQFDTFVNAFNCVEADLFGYMKTFSGQSSFTRSAVVRFSPAVALEPLAFDLEFGTNKNFADRVGTNPNIYQFEHQYALYTYTITVDLDRLSVEFNKKGEPVGKLPKEERVHRLKMVIEAIPFLSREIKGRIENLSPLFAIGGFYPVKNPFFLGKVEVGYDKASKKFAINPKPLTDILSLSFKGNRVAEDTKVGLLSGLWANEKKIKEAFGQEQVPVLSVSDLFSQLLEEAESVFEE